MGAKKKNKANKLSRMSEEEKMRYLQHRAAIEEESKRRKEQLISTFLKNKLKREQIFSRLNVAKINQQWRQILRQFKCFELKEELEDLKGWFDYALNKSNQTIKIVLGDLEEAENQYSKIHWNQMETFDKLIKIHHQRVDHYHAQFKLERQKIYQRAILDINEIKNSYRNDEEQLQAALYRAEESFKQKISLFMFQHFSKTDEFRNNMLTDLENVKNSREAKIESLWHDFEVTLKQYWEQTEDRRRLYMIMRETDYENCRQIFENNEQVNAAIDLIESLKDQLSKFHLSGVQLISNQKNNKEISRQHFYRLKKEVNTEIECDKRNLNFLNSIAGKKTDELKGILDKGEQILKLYSLCSNLEKENVKIHRDSWEKSHLTPQEEEELEKQVKTCVEPLTEAVCSDIMKLDGFWQRYNRVLLEKEALVLYHRSLLNMKKYLKTSLKNYLSDYIVKQPESKVSYANGVKFVQQRPATAKECKDAVRMASIKKVTSSKGIKSAAVNRRSNQMCFSSPLQE